MFEEMLKKYEEMEPAGSDKWTPLLNELEFWHRFRLYHQMRNALLKTEKNVTEMKFLDVGCGVGRSSRMLLEFGVFPQQITAIDIRPDAVATSKRINPLINSLYIPVSDLPRFFKENQFHFCMQATMFSSLLKDERAWLAGLMQQAVLKGGYLFWWDGINANTFAGSEEINPLQYFPKYRVLMLEEVSLRPSLKDAIPFFRRLPRFEAFLSQKILQRRITHCGALLNFAA